MKVEVGIKSEKLETHAELGAKKMNTEFHVCVGLGRFPKSIMEAYHVRLWEDFQNRVGSLQMSFGIRKTILNLQQPDAELEVQNSAAISYMRKLGKKQK